MTRRSRGSGTRAQLRRDQSGAGAGDFDVLAERGRRALRVHLGGDLASGLGALRPRSNAPIMTHSRKRSGAYADRHHRSRRMGGNITRRLMQHGPRDVVYDHDAEAVATRCGAKAPPATAATGELVGELTRAARGLGHAAGRQNHRRHDRKLGRLAAARRRRASTAAIHSGRTISAAPRS